MLNVDYKHDVGSEVYFLSENKVVTGKVKEVTIKVTRNHYNVQEVLVVCDVQYRRAERADIVKTSINQDLLFSTKDELLKSL